MVPRRTTLLPCILCGTLTVAALSIQYYASSGCAASRAAGRRFDGRQVSDQMCCPVGRVLSAIGLTLTSILGIWGIHRAGEKLDLGQCCCCSRCSSSGAGRAAARTFRATCVGLCGVGIFDLCWTATVHGISALLFFGSGYILIGIVCFSRKDGVLSVCADKHRAVLPVLALAAIPVARVDTLTGEWLSISAIALTTCVLEHEIRKGEKMMQKDPAPDDYQQRSPSSSSSEGRKTPILAAGQERRESTSSQLESQIE